MFDQSESHVPPLTALSYPSHAPLTSFQASNYEDHLPMKSLYSDHGLFYPLFFTHLTVFILTSMWASLLQRTLFLTHRLCRLSLISTQYPVHLSFHWPSQVMHLHVSVTCTQLCWVTNRINPYWPEVFVLRHLCVCGTILLFCTEHSGTCWIDWSWFESQVWIFLGQSVSWLIAQNLSQGHTPWGAAGRHKASGDWPQN